MRHRSASIIVVLLAFLPVFLGFASHANAAATLGVGCCVVGEEDWPVLGKSGARLYRVTIDKTKDEAEPGVYDKLFENAWKQGIRILPILARSSVEVREREGKMVTLVVERFPLLGEFSAWQAWVGGIVKRYGEGGSFWAGKANPLPVSAWEVWNEPNLPQHNPLMAKGTCEKEKLPYNAEWGTCVQPENYGLFLVATSLAIRTAHTPAAPVLFGGVLQQTGVPGKEPVFATAYLAAAASAPEAGVNYDGIAIHPYSFNAGPTGMVTLVEKARNAMDKGEIPGGENKPLWITEFGWPVQDPKGERPTVSEPQQAKWLTESVNWVKANATGKKLAAAVWYDARDGNTGESWDQRSGLRDEVGNFRQSWFALQEEAEAPRWPRPIAAFQANTNALWTYNRVTGPVTTTTAMEPKSSPAIGQYRGSHLVAVQSSAGKLALWSPSGTTSTELAVRAGTSPAISALEGGAVAFQAPTGHLWIYVQGGTAHDTGALMAPGTSPSITALPRVSFPRGYLYAVAFQGADGNLHIEYVYPGADENSNTGYGMASGSSPSIAALDGSQKGPYVAIAFQANTGELWMCVPGGVVATTGLGMAAGSSPSITATPNGNFAIAMRANTGALWTYVPNGPVNGTPYGIEAGANPSITGLPEDPYYGEHKVAFNSGVLWLYEPNGWVTGSIYGNQPGTSPSISPG